MDKVVQIIQIASKEPAGILEERLQQFKDTQLSVEFTPVSGQQHSWPYSIAPVKDRSHMLNEALLNPQTKYIWCARGGYGVSDLLPLIPWNKVKSVKPKIIIGFSDICALQSALYTKLAWPSIHAPMPGTASWEKNTDQNIKGLISSIKKNQFSGKLSLTAIGDDLEAPVSGKMFGGCFSVLTNLIGTEYFPSTLDDHILFIEDIDENPGRIMRYLNQWLQAGILANCKAIILGAFKDCIPSGQPDDLIYQQFSERCGVPLFSCQQFGHIEENTPIGIGTAGTIKESKLVWQLDNQA